MTDLNVLEQLRTKEELVKYFEKMGENITDEEIENLKLSYEQSELNGSHLTIKQLDNVAGGEGGIMIFHLEPLGTGQPTMSLTLRDGKTIQGIFDIEAYYGGQPRSINPNPPRRGITKILELGNDPIIDLSSTGKGQYLVSVNTEVVSSHGLPSIFTDFKKHPINVIFPNSLELGNNSIPFNLDLNQLENYNPELYSAIFESPYAISFVESQSCTDSSGMTTVLFPIPEPDQAARDYLETLIINPNAFKNDNSGNEKEGECCDCCTIM